MSETLRKYETAAVLLGHKPATTRLRVKVWRLVAAPPEQATPTDILEVIARPSAAASRRTYALQLRAGWRDMRRLQILTGEYPLADYPLPPAAPPQPRPFSAEQVERLLAQRDPLARDMTILGVKAGLRLSEVHGLRPTDYADGYLFVRGKSRDERLPVSPAVADVVARWEPVTVRPWSLTRRWSVGAASVGVDGRYHQCRATYATTLAAAGVDLLTVSAALRHRALSSTLHYVRASDAAVASAVGLI